MTVAPRRVWLLPLIVAAVGGLVYVNALPNGFALDDVPLVRDNPDVQSAGLRELALRPYWGEHGAASGLYRPLTIASLNLNRRLFGAGPAGFHAVNVCLHMLVCALVWSVARGSGFREGAALATGLLFAVHPLHTEAVANIVGRAELLAAAAALASWLALRRGWLVPAASCYLLALLAKEGVVLMPLVFLVGGSQRRRIMHAAAAFGSALLVGVALRFVALGGLRGTSTVAFIDNPAAFAGAWVRIGTALWVQIKYALLFFWPFGLSSDYSFDAIPAVDSWLDPRLGAGIAWALALAVAFGMTRRRARPVALGIAVWVAALLPASNFLFVSGTIMAERLAYLPSLGGCLVLGYLFARVGRSWLPVAGALAVLLAFSWGTLHRNPAWKDNGTLALRDAESQPRSAKLHAGAGIVLHDRGELDAAVTAYRKALAIYPGYAQIHYNLGELLLVQNRTREAIDHLRTAAELAPGNPRPHKTLAPLLERVGLHREALAHYEAGSRIDRGDFGFRFNYGRLLLGLGRNDEAREVFRRLLADPAVPPGIRSGAARRLEAATPAPGERPAP